MLVEPQLDCEFSIINIPTATINIEKVYAAILEIILRGSLRKVLII